MNYRLNWRFRNEHQWSKDFDKIGEVFQYFDLLALKNDPNISKVWIEKIKENPQGIDDFDGETHQVIETLV